MKWGMNRAIGAAILLHLLLLLPLIWHWTSDSSPRAGNTHKSDHIISAVALDQEVIHRQVQQLKRAELQRQQALHEQQQRLQQMQLQARRVAEQKQAEEEQLKQLQEQQKKVAEEAQRQKKQLEAQQAAKPTPKPVESQSRPSSSTPTKTKEKLKATRAETSKKDSAAAEHETSHSEAASHSTTKQETNAPTTAAKETQDNGQKEEALRIQGEISRYQQLIVEAIGRRWIMPEGVDKRLSAKILIRLAPGGVVLDVQIIRSSGHEALDQSAIAAVYKASPLPVSDDATVFNHLRMLNLTVRPEGRLQ